MVSQMLPVLNTPPLQRTDLTRAFDKFHASNPDVWHSFDAAALALAVKGVKRYGAKTIYEHMRYMHDLQTTGVKYKLTNNHTPYYARLFKQQHPQYGEFFMYKRVRGER